MDTKPERVIDTRFVSFFIDQKQTLILIKLIYIHEKTTFK